LVLQENSTLQRLRDEKAVLEGSVGYLRAKLALETVWSSTSDSGEAESSSSSESPPSPPPSPGPD
jgi:hypothetical protein